MESKFAAIAGQVQDYKEFDKLLKLITPNGIVLATIKGVKKPAAKLKFAAMPFSFCEYTASQKGNYYVITGACALEDLFAVTCALESLTAASLMAEAAIFSFGEYSCENDCSNKFVFLLKCLSDLIGKESNPYLVAIKFLQFIIHDSGYEYVYDAPVLPINTPLKLLSLINNNDNLQEYSFSDSLVKRTLTAIIKNFESKFEVCFNSKVMI